MSAFDPRQERDALPTRAIVRAALAVVFVLACAVVASFLLLRARSNPSATSDHSASLPFGTPPPAQIGIVEQRLVASTKRGLDANAAGRDRLDHYGWVDRERGIVRIPIARAIDLTVGEHAP